MLSDSGLTRLEQWHQLLNKPYKERDFLIMKLKKSAQKIERNISISLNMLHKWRWKRQVAKLRFRHPPNQRSSVSDHLHFDKLEWKGSPATRIVSEYLANSTRLWKARQSELYLVTGYGLSGDGLWRRPSWLISKEQMLVETTEVRVKYFGVQLSEKQVASFSAVYLEM